MMTARPIANTVRMPFTLEAHVKAMKVPQARSHIHQSNEKSLKGC